MNAHTKLCIRCLAAGVQVVASQGELCEYCAKGGVHPAVAHKNENGLKKPGAVRASSQIGKPRRSRWDALIFDPLRKQRKVTLELRTAREARDAACALRILDKSRNLPGFRFSTSGCVLTAWCEKEKAVSYRADAARIREAML